MLTASQPKPVIAIKSERDEAEAIAGLLGLKAGDRKIYDLREGAALALPDAEREYIVVRTRSLLSAMVYLSQGVRIPEEHIEKGFTSREWPPGNEGLDIEALFQIQFSKDNPDTDLAIKHRGCWFYIPATDLTSRYAFFTLSELMRLGLSETSAQEAPILTLPVGGP